MWIVQLVRRGLILLAVAVLAGSLDAAWSQPKDSNELALAIISAWQGSPREPTPEARAQKIEQALALAVPANPWPFREPARDDLLGEMWGQLGNEYRRIEGANRPAALERALVAYQEALKHLAAKRGANWARASFGLGNVYVDRVKGERSDNIERAIAALNASAELMDKAAAPSHWGSIQVNLSRAYWYRIQGKRADNLERSVEAAEAALSVFSRDKAAGDWGTAQLALGAAYWGRINGVRADNVDKAISAYEQALGVVSRERSATAWARVHDNLGMAYAERSRGTPLDNVQRAAAHFEQAAGVFTREAHPSEWAQLNMNFGLLLLDDELPADRVETAIERFKDALIIYTPQSFPERWARVMLNLGIAFARRTAGDRAENIEQAIAAYQNGLSFYTRDSDPVKWASAQNNLGIVLRKRLRGDRAANLAAAAAAHDAALSVYTQAAFPWLHLRSSQLAAGGAAARSDWSEAMRYYRSAIEASHQLFAGGLNRAEAEGVVREGGELFSGAAYAAVMQDAPGEALEILESGKARVLRVALGLDALELLPAQRQRLDRTRTEIRELEGRIDLLSGEERLKVIRQLEQLRANLQSIVNEASAGSRNPAARPGGLATAEALLAHYKAIVLPIVTDHGATLLIVARKASGTSVTPIAVKGLDSAALNRFLYGAKTSGKVSGWLGAYAINHLSSQEQQTRRPEWLRAIEALPSDLGDLVGAALADGLGASGVERNGAVLWLPQGALGLLPIMVAHAGTSKTTLLDSFTFSTAPSLAAAQAALARANAPAAPLSLTAVVNPTGDLAFTEPEAAAAASHFEPSRRTLLDAKDARTETVLASLAKSNHWHFATHGMFSWTNAGQSALLLAADDRLTIRNLLDRVGLGQPRLVVLSACETGIFDFRHNPDEFIGLPVAFLQAGAAGVIGSLWPVDDTSTALIMIRFYDLYLAKRTPPALALRQAQLWLRDAARREILAFLTDMRRTGRLSSAHQAQLTASLAGDAGEGKPFSHPYYWAAFQFYGL